MKTTVTESLKEYFKNTPKDQVIKDWESVSEFDNVNSPKVSELFEGGDGEKKCCDNPDIQWNKIEISIGDKQGSYRDLNFNFCDNCGETFNESFD